MTSARKWNGRCRDSDAAVASPHPSRCVGAAIMIVDSDADADCRGGRREEAAKFAVVSTARGLILLRCPGTGAPGRGTRSPSPANASGSSLSLHLESSPVPDSWISAE